MSMKKYILLGVIIVGLLASCDKNLITSPYNTSITGRWKLLETLSDPGDGSGEWVKAKSNNSFIQINGDGTFRSFDTEFNGVRSYKIIDSSVVELTFDNNTSKINYRYKLDGSKLELNPPCIEACGFKYLRVSN